MEKEFVPYEFAVLLKHLGFNEPCFAFYQREYAEVTPTMVDDNEQYKLTGFRTCKNSEIPEHYVSAPLFSQAFRWFREKYELFSSCDISNFADKTYGYVITSPIPPHYLHNVHNLKSMEEAEIACLTNLIEIVESKSE